MTFLALDTHHAAPLTLSLDAVSLALLRTISSGRAPHPALGGPAGARARRRLVAQGAITAFGELTEESRHLVAPIERADRTLQIHVAGAWPRSRQIWTDGSRSTALTPRPDGTLTISSCRHRHLGAELTTWLGIRPLPEPTRRTARVVEAGDLIELSAALSAGDHGAAAALASQPMRASRRHLFGELVSGNATAWTIDALPVGRPERHRSVTAIDAGRDGWWLSSALEGARSDELVPVGVAAVYVALSQLIR